MTNPGLVIIAIITLAALYVLLPVMFPVLRRFCGVRTLRCPESGESVEVRLDGQYAALSSVIGKPHLRAKDCSLWPERGSCRQGCIRRLQTCLSKV
jgi:hypothetical protein